MNIHHWVETCQFVSLTNLFKDADQALDAFHNLDHDCTWGTNKKTLVDTQYIAAALENILQEWEGLINTLEKVGHANKLPGEPTSSWELPQQCNLVIGRCTGLGKDILVDLEK